MKKIGFIGVGNMGGPMAVNLNKAGYDVTAFDLLSENLNRIAQQGVAVVDVVDRLIEGTDIIITMLPAGQHVKSVYFDNVFDCAPSGTLMMDCSTIDVETARLVHDTARSYGFPMLDAPVSGGIGGAAAGTLTFMVGGEEQTFIEARTILKAMGKNIVHCGPAGAGQAAKVCNNMMLGIQMSSVAEAFVLAEKLGLSAQKLFEVSSTASGQCWSLTSYCPVPGPVPTSPANRDYEPGFSAALMLKDLELALSAASHFGANIQVAQIAAKLYRDYVEENGGNKDFSSVINHIRNS